MPMTSNVAANFHELKHSDKKRSRAQMIAIALEGAREHGNKSVGPSPKNGKTSKTRKKLAEAYDS